MDETSIAAELQKKFPASGVEDWKKIAIQETGGTDPFEKLSWRGKDDILFLPYYDAASQIAADAAPPAAGSGFRQWLNLPSLKLNNADRANAQALDHLMHGADGFVCDVRNILNLDVNRLTNNIEWPHCYIGFYTCDQSALPGVVEAYLRNTFASSAVNGAFFWESIPKKGDLDFYFDRHAAFKSLGMLIPPSSPAREIGEALRRGVAAFEMFQTYEKPERVFRSIAFSLPADATFLETIAKFKALRRLWLQVARAYGYSNYDLQDLFVHGRSIRVADGAYGPYENMLKGTFSAMTAILGGCDALTVESYEAEDFNTRCARNVSLILREESYFDRATDALAGAWTIEALTDAIAQKGWEVFQQKLASDAA